MIEGSAHQRWGAERAPVVPCTCILAEGLGPQHEGFGFNEQPIGAKKQVHRLLTQYDHPCPDQSGKDCPPPLCELALVVSCGVALP